MAMVNGQSLKELYSFRMSTDRASSSLSLKQSLVLLNTDSELLQMPPEIDNNAFRSIPATAIPTSCLGAFPFESLWRVPHCLDLAAAKLVVAPED
jgi:hypothetical protein